ncbi:Endoglucanase E-4 [Orchesella cincta]|uniref:Endoglucanase n=1 Tax=Orchesella cincta TaxID=48709 RepID=A0A1D2MPN1_ORCCI|nr:Endoglucanase E-4 [Orchesella cincta]
MSVLKFIVITLLGLFCYVAVTTAQYNYGEVIEKSLLFYEAQRLGRLPSSNRIPWRGDAFVSDRGQNGEDLSGGYCDAGDFVKFGFPFTSAMTMLAWGMADFKAGYVKAGQWDYAKDALKWGLDYMIKSHPEPNVLYVQVGDANVDHSYWGRPEDWPTDEIRPTLRATTRLPASEVAAEQAAAMAAASGIYRADGDNAYASTLLQHARDLYTFATTNRGKYSDSFPEAAEYYESYSGFGDEFLWAAAWLYRVTNESKFQQDYERFYTEFDLNGRPVEASWDDKAAQAQVLLAKVDGSNKYVNAARTFCDWVVDQAPKTPKGLVFISQWGSLRHAANVALTCLQAAEAGINASKYRAFAKQQIDYMLGSTGRSFVCGYGNNPPQRPHHASSSCPNRPAPCDWDDFSKPGPNSQVLHGALVGGPNRQDQYNDDREDYVANEVTIDYNAGFQGALAALNILN